MCLKVLRMYKKCAVEETLTFCDNLSPWFYIVFSCLPNCFRKKYIGIEKLSSYISGGFEVRCFKENTKLLMFESLLRYCPCDN